MNSRSVFPSDDQFIDPPWNAPLDASDVLRSVPESATISGMFPDAVLQQAQQANVSLPSARDRYTKFRFYPLREFTRVLIEGCEIFFPGTPLRLALRKMGRAGPKTLISSTVGRVVFGSAEGALAAIEAMAKAYSINVRPSHVEVVAASEHRAIIRVRELHYFLDSHHIGVFEGTLRHAGVKGTVKICAYGPAEADILCSWRGS
jgi:uncharacterized protein (TIGR02265 family)